MTLRLRLLLAFSVPLSYAAGLWLVLIHEVEGSHEQAEPSLILHWLRDSTLALPAVAAAVWLALRVADRLLDRRDAGRSAGLGRAVTAAAVALAAAAATAVGSPAHEWLFGAHELPLAIHMLRDALLALFVTAPVAAVVAALTGAERPAPEPLAGENGRRTTRAAFLKAGAGGLVSVAAGGAVISRSLSSSSATAASTSFSLSLLITEGYVQMTDGSPAFMRGFAINKGAGSPMMIPGPVIGRDPDPLDNGEVPFVLEGETIYLTIKNTLKDDHSFVIDGVVGPISIPAGEERQFTFPAPRAGTYLYRDADRVQRLLGLHGAMVVMPADRSRRPYIPRPGELDPPTFHRQFVWVFADVDPVWGEKARTGQPIEFKTLLPRFFCVNGVSGEQSVDSERNSPRQLAVADGATGEGVLIRMVNASAATHSPHFHGNHLFQLTANGSPLRYALEKDVFMMSPLDRKDVLLPFHEPLDQWPPYDATPRPHYRYPMHCHAEMSQTAGGGQYPSGMYTEWELSGPLGKPAPPGG